MKELTIQAVVENLDNVIAFVTSFLEEMDCPLKEQMPIEVAVEEIFVNIAHYAYKPETGMAHIVCKEAEDDVAIEISFEDNGMPFDPLAKADPDVTLSVEDRPIGGLGIFMVKKSMDDVHYEYKDGKNIFTMRKNLTRVNN